MDTVEKYVDGDEVISEVTLESGYKIRFFARDLTDDEYIKRARILEKKDKESVK